MDNTIYTFDDKYWGQTGAGVIFYYQNDNEILLGLRSNAVNEANTWGTIGGQVDECETPERAARREVHEEGHIKGNYKLKLLYVYKDGKFRYYNYIVPVKMKFKPKPNWEVDRFQWFNVNNLPTNLHFGVKSLLPSLKLYIKNAQF